MQIKRKYVPLIFVVSALLFTFDYLEIDFFLSEENETEIFWSIIIVARNDNYGTTFTRRLQAFINSIGYYDKKFKWKMELIICQWNPIEDKPLIEDLYTWNFNQRVRIITVPNNIHMKFQNGDLFLLHEYIAKNTAARRAQGKWLLFTNPDDIFNVDVAKRLSQFNLWDNRCYYRVDRLDFSKPLEKNIHPSKYDKECRKTATVLVGQKKLANNKEFWEAWDSEAKKRKVNGSLEITWPNTNVRDYFTSASGDFFAIKAEKFLELKGHPEEGKYGTMDAVIMWIAGIAGKMCQGRLFTPYVICHQSHDRGNNTKLTPADYLKYRNLTELGINPQFNNDSWGLRDEILYENVYSHGVWKKQESIIYLK